MKFRNREKLIRGDRDQKSDNFWWVIGGERARVSLLGAENILYLDLSGGYMVVYIYNKSSSCMLKIYVFYQCKLYINRNVFKCCRIKEISMCMILMIVDFIYQTSIQISY